MKKVRNNKTPESFCLSLYFTKEWAKKPNSGNNHEIFLLLYRLLHTVGIWGMCEEGNSEPVGWRHLQAEG